MSVNQALPAEFGNLTNLTYLILNNNQLNTLPAEFGNLVNLEGLTLSDNQLNTLPTQFGNLVNLERLYLDSNQLRSSPSEIGYLTNLTSLDLSSNGLSTLPTEFGNLVNLDFLDLGDNRLTILPREIGNLANLTGLGLRDNRLTTLPYIFRNLPKHTRLYLDPEVVIQIAPSHKNWTLLIYAVGDNDLDIHLSDRKPEGMLSRLRKAGIVSGVQVGILYDGPGDNGTYWYVLNPDGTWKQHQEKTEKNMGEEGTLKRFIEWGYDTLPSANYSLSLLGHANGIKGLGPDISDNKDFLTPSEIRNAIQGATIDRGNPLLNILHIDGCSFGLFENTSIAQGLADYMIASPNTGWGIFAYDEYRYWAGQSETPLDYARNVANHYADTLEEEYGYPYTISVFDMAHYEAMKESINVLGTELTNYVGGSTEHSEKLRDSVRRTVQKYDSGNYIYILEEKDDYVDLGHLAHELSSMGGAIVQAADGVNASLAKFVEHTRNKSGEHEEYGDSTFIDLEEARGLAIYYPYSAKTASTALKGYYDNTLFPALPQEWGWTQFLKAVIPPSQVSSASAQEDKPRLLAPLMFGLYDDVLDEKDIKMRIYLPLVNQ